jgi:hypothetical protein
MVWSLILPIDPTFQSNNNNIKRKVVKYESITAWQCSSIISSTSRREIYGTDIVVLDFDLDGSDEASIEPCCSISVFDWQGFGVDGKALCSDTNNTVAFTTTSSLNAKQEEQQLVVACTKNMLQE